MVLSEYDARCGKTDIQLEANEEKQDCAQRGKDEARRMIPFVCRTRKHVGKGPPMIDPTTPITIAQKIIMCTCITDFAIIP
jgi:hypothetical protein